jgi:hypothetical protein
MTVAGSLYTVKYFHNAVVIRKNDFKPGLEEMGQSLASGYDRKMTVRGIKFDVSDDRKNITANNREAV